MERFSTIICEKPDQAKKIASPFPHKQHKGTIEIKPCETFPKGAVVVHAIGHICEMASPGDYHEDWNGAWSFNHLPMLPEQFKIKVTPSKAKAFQTIKKHVMEPKVEQIIAAGDAAREGELLITEILVLLNNKKPVKRLWTQSLTKNAILKAMNNLKDSKDTLPLYYEALARQRVDWIIGMNFTRCMTLLLQSKGVPQQKGTTFSVGRCQTPLINIIHQRDIAIEKFKSQKYWDVFGKFSSEGMSIQGKWYKPGEEHLFHEEEAKGLTTYCLNKQASIFSANTEEKRVRPPQLYNLTTLQKEVNDRLGISTDEVLNVAQGLYEKGFISYPRSEPRHVNCEEAISFPNILEKLTESESYSKYLPAEREDISTDARYVDDSKTDDHYAIIITEEIPNISSLTSKEKLVYDMIAKSLIAAHYPDAVDQHKEITILVDNKFSFKAKSKRELSPGWRKLYKEEDSKTDTEIELPDFKEGDSLSVHNTWIEEGITQPPSRFTEGQLVTIMQNAYSYLSKEERKDFEKAELALGTVATRANIISKIKSMNYISIQKNKVYIEPKGRILMQALESTPFLTSPGTTGKMERYLSLIGKGEKPHKTIVQRTSKITNQLIEELIKSSDEWQLEDEVNQLKSQNEVGICFECKEPVVDRGSFYGCTGYRSNGCSFTIPKEKNGKKLTNKQISSIMTKGTSPLIKGFSKNNKEGTFDAYLVWDSNKKKITFSFEGVGK